MTRQNLKFCVFVYFLLWVSWTTSFGQNYSIKKLKADLLACKNEGEQAEVYWKLARDYVRVRYDSGIWYGEEAIRISRKNNLTETLAWSLLYTANICQQQDDLESAFHYLGEARKLFQQLTLDSVEQAKIYNIVGSTFYSANYNDSALHYFVKGAEFGGRKFINPIAGIGNVYSRVNIDTAIYYYKIAFASATDPLTKVLADGSLGECYYAKGKFDSSIYFLKEAINGSNRFGTKILTEHISRILALAYLESGNVTEAKKLSSEALIISQSIGSVQNEANDYNLLASIAFEEGKFEESMQWSKRANEIGEKNEFHYITAEASMRLMKCALALGRKADARKFEEEYNTAVDLENKKNYQASIAQYQVRYEALKKEKENFELRNEQLRSQAQIQKQRNISLIIGGVLLITVILGVFVYRSYHAKLKNSQVFQTKNLELSNQQEEILIQKGMIERQHDLLVKALKEREEAQSLLVHSEKMASLGQLMAGIAHELNNPVNFITSGTKSLQGEIDTLRETIEEIEQLDYQSAEKVQNKLNRIWKEIDTLLQAIRIGSERTMKTVSGLKVFAYQSPEKLQRVDVKVSLEATLVVLNNEMKTRINVHKDFEEIPLVECNIGEISQVFMNVFMNSIQAIPNEGNIWVHVFYDRELQEVSVVIKDDGEGIKQEVINKIFEPFFTTKPIGKGTGLGLSISHKIMEKHRGKLNIQSEGGKGTEVRISLPLRQQQV